MKFVIATHNPHKCEELARILEPLGITAVTDRDLGKELPEGAPIIGAEGVQLLASDPASAMHVVRGFEHDARAAILDEANLFARLGVGEYLALAGGEVLHASLELECATLTTDEFEEARA